MRRLALRSLGLLALRWLRRWGYRGRHPGAIYAVLLALLGAASIGAAFWTHGQFEELNRLPGQFRPGIVAVLVLFLFMSGGLMLLLTESIRVSGSRLAAVLGALPLTNSEIRLLLWLPVFAASAVMQIVLFVPAVVAFSALRFPMNQSLLAALASLLSGYAMATVLVAFVRFTFAGREWASVRYPVMLLGWMAVCGVEIWQTILDIRGGQAAWRIALLAPWLSRELGRGSISSLQFALVITAILGTAVLLSWSGGRSGEADYRPVAWQWSSSWKPALLTLELTRMLRSRYLIANLVGGEVIGIGLAFALWKLPPIVRPYLFVAVLSTMVLFCALPLVLIRGLTAAKWPPALLLGFGATEWTLSQVAVAITLASSVAIPPLGVATWLLGSAHDVLVVGPPLLLLSCALALYVGWLVPSSSDDPLGQAVSTFTVFLVIQILELVLDRALHAGTLLWALSILLIGSLGIAGATLVERRRWNQLIGSIGYA
jgi:hypothetical protein